MYRERKTNKKDAKRTGNNAARDRKGGGGGGARGERKRDRDLFLLGY